MLALRELDGNLPLVMGGVIVKGQGVRPFVAVIADVGIFTAKVRAFWQAVESQRGQVIAAV
ncbi:hypothetical protein LG58_2180 [Kosakonia radicincitans YD4]|nr:hypothetical protein LG58_2180 [Kosakonia radicincitans YD4]